MIHTMKWLVNLRKWSKWILQRWNTTLQQIYPWRKQNEPNFRRHASFFAFRNFTKSNSFARMLVNHTVTNLTSDKLPVLQLPLVGLVRYKKVHGFWVTIRYHEVRRFKISPAAASGKNRSALNMDPSQDFIHAISDILKTLFMPSQTFLTQPSIHKMVYNKLLH